MSDGAINALVNGADTRAPWAIVGGPAARNDAGAIAGSSVAGMVRSEVASVPDSKPAKSADRRMLDVRQSVGVFASPHQRYAVGLPAETNLDLPVTALSEGNDAVRLVAILPPVYPEWLGTRRFTTHHGCRFPYVVGAMARGITTARMVKEAAAHGLIGFFGAAGLRPPVVAEAIAEIRAGVDRSAPWGSNLIHSPDRPERERDIVDLYLDQSVSRVSASAFMKLSPEVVRYSAGGLTSDGSGTVVRKTHVFAKVSRPEVAKKFMAPPPVDLLRELAAAGRISAEQAEFQSRLPVAEDITVEADSGGHTDNRPLTAVFPIIASLRDRLVAKHRYERPIRLGAAGGLGTPHAIAAAFQLGADYVLTGSINQAAVESGLSEQGRRLLAECDFTDVMMAPAADMFERGAKVQVLKKGTMFAVSAQRLLEIYRRHDSFEALPAKERDWLESTVFKQSWAEMWSETRSYHASSNPAIVAQADSDPKKQLALAFRRYLFMASHWAREGRKDRRLDYQIWCGPAMGAFNDWVGGSFLEPLENRTIGQIALNLLESACVATRIQQLHVAGVDVPDHRRGLAPKHITLG